MDNTYKTARITKITKESEKVKTYILDVSVSAKPGQYVMVWIPGLNEKPFGVVTGNPFSLSIANVGSFTKKIHELKKGDLISYRGPYGSSFKQKGKQSLFVCGGYGVVPLYFFASKLMEKKKNKITVVLGAKTKKDIIFVDKFKKIGCRVLISTDDGTQGFKGYSTQLTEQALEKETFDSVYSCGPEIMMNKVAELSRKRRIFCQISIEREFKCGGIGLCGSCSCGGKLVCKDGPVFNGNTIVCKSEARSSKF